MKICPYCQTQNRDEARFCFRCGKPITDQPTYPEPTSQQPVIQVIQTPPPKKSKLGWIVGSIVVLVMIFCIAFILLIPKSETPHVVTGPGTKVGEATGIPQTPTPIKVKTFQAGDIVAVGDHTIVLNSTLVNGNRIQANFTIENKGKEDISFSTTLRFSAKDAEGTKLSQDIFDCGTGLDSTILPGDKLKGDLCYDGAVNYPVRIYYTAELFGTGAVVWEIAKP